MYIHTACGIETVERRLFAILFMTYMYIHTACGIETTLVSTSSSCSGLTCTSIPLAVLKQHNPRAMREQISSLTCTSIPLAVLKQLLLQEINQPLSLTCTSIPLAVLKLSSNRRFFEIVGLTCTSIPLAVLKLFCHDFFLLKELTYMYIHTACGMETLE